MADQPYGVGINLDNTGLVRIRRHNARTHRRHLEHVVTRLTVLGPARPAHAEVCGLAASNHSGPGAQYDGARTATSRGST